MQRRPLHRPSRSPIPETWLDFTDLVFIDPAGTGYSRLLGSNDAARRRLWSVDGDIDSLAETIRRWLDRFERGISPKYLLGESYGGFRAPRLARELANGQGTGVSGLILVSPALDLGGRSLAFDPFSFVTRLPSMAAAARAARAPVTRAEVVDVERYAATDYLLDLTRGERDQDAIARRSERVAEYTRLDPVLVQRYHGKIDNNVFLREIDRAHHRIGSAYDATITGNDPFPLATVSNMPDPAVDALRAPVSSAMVAIYETRLNWRPDNPYQLYSAAANRQWDWGRGLAGRTRRLVSCVPPWHWIPHFSGTGRARPVRPGHAVLCHAVAAGPDPGGKRRRSHPTGSISRRPHVLFTGPVTRRIPQCCAGVVRGALRPAAHPHWRGGFQRAMRGPVRHGESHERGAHASQGAAGCFGGRRSRTDRGHRRGHRRRTARADHRRRSGPAVRPFEPTHRSLQSGIRSWVERQTHQPLGYVEQLYTFADRDRTAAGQRMVSISYLGLTREVRAAGEPGVGWQGGMATSPGRIAAAGRVGAGGAIGAAARLVGSRRGRPDAPRQAAAGRRDVRP